MVVQGFSSSTPSSEVMNQSLEDDLYRSKMAVNRVSG
jgi:hypothetical protein